MLAFTWKCTAIASWANLRECGPLTLGIPIPRPTGKRQFGPAHKFRHVEAAANQAVTTTPPRRHTDDTRGVALGMSNQTSSSNRRRALAVLVPSNVVVQHYWQSVSTSGRR